MNIRRPRGEHVEFESRSYYWAYTAEMEVAAMTLWNLLYACDEDEVPFFVCAFEYAICAGRSRVET